MSWGAIGSSVAGAAASYLLNDGGGGGGSTSSTGPDPRFNQLAQSVNERGQQIGNMEYQPYPYAMTAGFSPYQFAGFDMTADRAMNSDLPWQAESALGGVLGGGNWYGPQQTDVGWNPMTGAQTQVGANPYAGANPYLEQNINSTLDDITQRFNTSVAPSMAAQAFQGGSFGNTGAAEMETQARQGLAKTLGQTAGNMRMQDYGMQQGLAESDISRRMGAQQTDIARNAGLYGQDISNRIGAQQADMNRNLQGYDAAQGRMMQGLGLAPSVYGLGYQPADRMLGIGGTMQQQQQNELNALYGQFQESQAWPFKTYDAMMAPFGRGVTGSTTTTSGPGTNTAAGLLGGAMMGNRMWQDYQRSQPPAQTGGGVGAGGTGGYDYGQSQGWW